VAAAIAGPAAVGIAQRRGRAALDVDRRRRQARPGGQPRLGCDVDLRRRHGDRRLGHPAGPLRRACDAQARGGGAAAQGFDSAAVGPGLARRLQTGEGFAASRRLQGVALRQAWKRGGRQRRSQQRDMAQPASGACPTRLGNGGRYLGGMKPSDTNPSQAQLGEAPTSSVPAKPDHGENSASTIVEAPLPPKKGRLDAHDFPDGGGSGGAEAFSRERLDKKD
jgi:hypothetical protein